jgi:hypothetical protein
LLVAVVLSVLSQAAGALAQCPDDFEFTSEFPLEDCTFSADGRNPFFSLVPGDRLVLKGEDDGEEVVVEITVLEAKRWVSFAAPSGELLWVRTRVVREREWVDGELVEVSKNFFARCKETNDVYYFGEDVDIFEDDTVSHDGAWLAGKAGALPGLIMPGSFLLGSKYFQELAPGAALDRGEHTLMGLTVDVPAGTFEGCVEVTETNSLDCGADGTKLYCPGIGLVVDAETELAAYRVQGNDDDDDEEVEDDDGDDPRPSCGLRCRRGDGQGTDGRGPAR